MLSCTYMKPRLKQLAVLGTVLLIGSAVFTFLPTNPNTWLIKPLVADNEVVTADLGVVLGGGLKIDGSLSNVSQERVDYAVELHKESNLPLLFSGGETPSGVEAVVMNNYAKTQGYMGLDHIEASSHSTYENAQFTGALLDQGRFPDSTIQLITSPYHSRRALATFRKLLPDRRVFVTYPDTTAALTDTIRGRWRGLYVLTREYTANIWYTLFYRISNSMQPSEFVKGERLDFQMQDGTRVQADYYTGTVNKSVILLHPLRRDRHVWDESIPAFQAKGWHIMAVDLRGHGESEGDHTQYSEADFAKLPIDILALVAWLKQNQGPLDVVVVGASISANAAISAAAQSTTVDGLVALSPALNYHGITTDYRVRNVRVPVLYVTADDDEQSASAFPGLFSSTATRADDKEWIQYADGGHGTDLLSTQPDLLQAIVDFVDAL